MKYLFIVFLIINVIYLGYEVDKETHYKTQVHKQFETGNAKQLQLLSQQQRKDLQRLEPLSQLTELEADADSMSDNPMVELMRPDVAIEAVDSDSKLLQMLEIDKKLDLHTTDFLTAQSICMSLGPFDEMSSARDLISWITANKVIYVQRWTYEDDDQLFWVYLAPVTERSQALATLEQLQNQGVEDFRLIRKGSFKNAISLGLFSSQARVNRRLRDLNSKGYRPVVVPYGNEDSKKILWVDIQLSAEMLKMPDNHSFLATFNSNPIQCSEIDIAETKP